MVGYGLAGAVFHAPLIAVTPGLELSSVVTSNAERSAQAERDHPGVRVLPDADSLWQTADRHDLVVVAAPNRAHVPLAREAIANGLPVVVDKPLAPSAAEGRELVQAADAAGVMLTVFQNRRWDGDMLTLQRLIADGTLGPIVRFESRFERWRPEVDSDRWRERESPDEAGGLLFDLGSHLVDQAMVLFGRPLSVYAEIDRRRPGALVDDDFFVALEHPGGVRSHLSATMLAALPQARMRALGLAGAFVKDGLDPQEAALKQGGAPGEDGGREEGRLMAGREVEQIEIDPGAYERFYEGVAQSVTSGAPPPVDPSDAVRGLEVLEAARESARTGAVVKL